MAAKSRAAELKKIVEQSPEKRPSLLYKAVSKADAVEFLERNNAKWQNTSLVKECQLCKNGFSLVNRKHHCRECGGVFCGRCTSYKIVITGGLKRACLTCYNRITLKDGAASYTFSSDSSTTADRHCTPISVSGSERAEGGSSDQSGSGNTTDAETIGSVLSDNNPHSYSTSNKYNNSNNNSNISNMNRNSSNGLPPWVEALMFVRRHGEEHGDEEGNVEAVFPEESLPPGLIKDIRSTALLNPYRPSKQQDFRFLFRVRDKTAAGAGTETEITNTTVFYNCYVLYRQQVVREGHSSASGDGVGGSASRVPRAAVGVGGGDQNRGSDLFSSVGLGGDGINVNRESERGSIVAEELGIDEEDPDLMRQALILVSKWPFPKIAFRILEKLDEAFVWQADPATMSSASLGGGPIARSNRSGSMSISMVGGGGKSGIVTRRTNSMSFDLGIETGLDLISSALGGATRSGALSLGGGPSAVGNGSGDAGGVGSRGGSLSSAGGVFGGEDNNALGRSSTAMLKTNDVDDETSANVLMVGFGQMQMWPKPIPGKSIYFHFLGEMIPFQVAGDALTTYGANMSFAPIFASMNLVSLFGPHGLLQYLWTLWELVVSAQDIIVFSTSPTQCSEFVLALASLMLPLSNVGDIRPYIDGKDSDMRVFAMNAVEKSRKGGATADAAEEEERQQQQQLQRQNSEDGSLSSHNGRSTRTGSVASSSTVGGPGAGSAKSSGGGGGYSGLREARQRSTIVGISDPYALSRLEDFGAAIFLSPAPAGGAFRDPDAVLNGLRPRNSAFCVQLGVGGVTGDAGSTAGTALSHIAGAPPVFVTNAFTSASATGLLNVGNAGVGGLGGLGGLGTGSGTGNRRMDSFYEYYTTWASEGCVRSAIVCRPKPSPFLLATNKPLEKIRRMNARDRVILGDKLLRDNIKSMTLAFFKPILGEGDNTSLEVANIRSIALEREELAHQKDQAAAVEETLTKKTALRHALFLGLAGNVKNLPDWMMRNMPTVILHTLCVVSALALYLAGVPSVLMVGALFIVKIPEKAPPEFEGLLRNYLPYWLLYPHKYRKRMAAAAARAAAGAGTGKVNEDEDDDDDDESEDLDEDGEAGGEEEEEGTRVGRPDFSGVWKRVRLDRYEDLLIAQNMPYLLRKVFLSTALNHVITMSEDLSAARIQEQGGPLQTDDVFLLGGPVQNINMMGKVDFECISYWEGKKFVHRRTRLPEKEIEIFAVREMTPDGQMKISGKIHFLKGKKPDAVGYTYFDFVSDSPHPRPPSSGYPLPPLRVKAKKTASKNKIKNKNKLVKDRIALSSAVRRDFSGVWKRVKLDRYEDLLVAQKIPYLTRMVFISTPLTHIITMSEDLSAARIQEQGGPLKTDDTFLLGGPVQNINMMGKVFFECTSYWEDTKFVHRRTRLPEKEIEIFAVREMISDTQIRISGMVRFLKEDKPDVYGYAYFEKQGPSPTERPPSSGYPVPPLLSSAASDDADVNSDEDVKSAHGGGGGSATSRQLQAGAASAAEKETAAAAASQAPRDFSGVWKRTRLDRYEDLLAAQNLNFVVRKLMLSTPITHIITMAENLTAVRIQVQGGPVQTDSVFPVGGGEAEISVMGKTTFLNSLYWAGGQLVQKSIVLPEKATEVYTIRELINERTIKITGKVCNLLSNKPDVYGYAYFELVGPSPNEPPAPAPGIKSPLPQFAAEDRDEDSSSNSSSGIDAADRDSKKGISGCEEMVTRRTATFSGSDLSASDVSIIATASAVTATNAATGGAGAELKLSVESSEVNQSGGEFSPMNLSNVDNTQPFSTLRATGGMKIGAGTRNTLLSHSLSPQPFHAMMQRDFSESSTGSCSVASEPQTTTAAATDAGADRSDATGAKSTNLGTPSGTKSKSSGQRHHHHHHRSAHSIKQDFSGTWRRTKVLNLDDWIGEQGGGFHDCKLAAELQLQHIITMDLPDLTTVRFQEVDPKTGILYTDFSLKIGADFVVTTRRRSIDAAAFSSGVEDGNRNENVSEESPASPISAASKMFGDMSSAHLRDGIDVLPSPVQMRSRAYWYKGNLIVRQLRIDDSLEFCYIRKLQKSNTGNGGGVGAGASGTGNSGKSASFGGIAFSGGSGAGGGFSDKRLRGGSMGSDMSGSVLGEDEEDDEEGAAQIFMMAKLINRASGRAVESTSWYSRLGPSPYSVIAGDVVETEQQPGCSGCAPPDAADAPTTKTNSSEGSLSIKLPSETSSASTSGGGDASAATTGAAGLVGKGGRGAVEAGFGTGGEGRPTTPINIQSVSAALVPSATHQQSAAFSASSAPSAAVAVATAMRNRETRESITGKHDIPSFDFDNSESESGNDTGMEEDSDFDRSADSDDDDDNVESMRSSFLGMDRSVYKHLKRGSKGSGGMMDAAALATKNAMTTPLESGSTETHSVAGGAGAGGKGMAQPVGLPTKNLVKSGVASSTTAASLAADLYVRVKPFAGEWSRSNGMNLESLAGAEQNALVKKIAANMNVTHLLEVTLNQPGTAGAAVVLRIQEFAGNASLSMKCDVNGAYVDSILANKRYRTRCYLEGQSLVVQRVCLSDCVEVLHKRYLEPVVSSSFSSSCSSSSSSSIPEGSEELDGNGQQKEHQEGESGRGGERERKKMNEATAVGEDREDRGDVTIGMRLVTIHRNLITGEESETMSLFTNMENHIPAPPNPVAAAYSANPASLFQRASSVSMSAASGSTGGAAGAAGIGSSGSMFRRSSSTILSAAASKLFGEGTASVGASPTHTSSSSASGTGGGGGGSGGTSTSTSSSPLSQSQSGSVSGYCSGETSCTKGGAAVEVRPVEGRVGEGRGSGNPAAASPSSSTSPSSALSSSAQSSPSTLGNNSQQATPVTAAAAGSLPPTAASSTAEVPSSASDLSEPLPAPPHAAPVTASPRFVSKTPKADEHIQLLKSQLKSQGIAPLEFIELRSIEQELQTLFDAANNGRPLDEARLDHLLKCMEHNPEYQRELAEKARKWRAEILPFARECLLEMRAFVPPNIFRSSVASLTAGEGFLGGKGGKSAAGASKTIADKEDEEEEEESDDGTGKEPDLSATKRSHGPLSPALAKRLMTKKCLWLVRMNTEDIQRLHEGDLFGRYNPEAQGLDIVETAAIYAVVPEKFRVDPTGKKERWRASLEQNLKSMYAVYRENRKALPSTKLRNPVYESEEPQFGGRLTLHEMSPVSSADAFKPRDSFRNLSSRK